MTKLPFKTSQRPIVTQEYGDFSNAFWYQQHGIQIPYHNGTDIVFGNSKQTYGTEIVCPFKKASVVQVWWNNPTDTHGNGVLIETDIDEVTKWRVLFWHSGEIAVKLGQELTEEDLICYVGNSGLVNPKPTSDAPWAGAHCHLGTFLYKWVTVPQGSYFALQEPKNGVNGALNPRLLFDFYSWYNGPDTGLAHDMWALIPWAKIQSNIVAWIKKIGL